MALNRTESIARLRDSRGEWDLLVIGGGATGIGIALDGASRGYRVALIEQSDFGKGTSSRSTKLIHGGVRYLKQGNVRLVREALHERSLLWKNAPHLVRPLGFVIPLRKWWERPFLGMGLKLYDALAGGSGFERSRHLRTDQVASAIPTIETRGLRGGVWYQDGQFDDTRLLIAMARTAEAHGAVLLNYARAGRILKREGRVCGVEVQDQETGEAFSIAARCVINATGPFCDALRHEDDGDAPPLVAASQGVHLVLPRSFLPGTTALIVPKTSDGRVMFAIPWHHHTLIGTTDTAITHRDLEPRALPEEIDFLLRTTREYLAKPVDRDDVTSVFVGIRPLVRSTAARTANLARDHLIQTSSSGLVTVTGGKWTTYRRMAQDAVDHVAGRFGLQARPCRTTELPLQGHRHVPQGESADSRDWDGGMLLGSDADEILRLIESEPERSQILHPEFPLMRAHIVWSVRREWCRTVEDFLARRTRVLFLNQRVATEMAPQVARTIAIELGRNATWEQSQVDAFKELAAGYGIGRGFIE